jgi:ribosomal protein S18 acetylase RimI-like enzyme
MDDLARVTDATERASLADWYGAAPADVASRAGVGLARADQGAVVAVLAQLPSAVYNRVLGLGLDQPASPEQLDECLGALDRLGAPCAFFHLAAYAPPELATWLEQRGVRRYQRSWMRFWRDTEPAREVLTDLVVRPARPSDAAALDAVIRGAFEMSDAAAGLFAYLVGRPRWHLFVAVEGDEVAGAAGLFVEGQVGHIAFGAVRAQSRRRGAQNALLAARIQCARDLGCRLVFSETGEAVAGSPQPSYQNLLRAGFKELYLRPNYRWARPLL